MGNSHSALIDESKLNTTLNRNDFTRSSFDSISLPEHNSPTTTKPTNNQKGPMIDFDNMPFLRPTGDADQSHQTSPSLKSTDLKLSPTSISTEWNLGHQQRPVYHRVNSSSHYLYEGEVSLSPGSSISKSSNRSPVISEQSFQFGSSTESSVSLQLSMLSQKHGGTSPRSHRYSFSHSPQHSEIEVDANVPPPVPPHSVVPLHMRHGDSFKEMALAEVDALEDVTEEDINVSRTRPRSVSTASRSRSLSRSLSRSMSRSMSRSRSLSNANITAVDDDAGDSSFLSLSTDIYTRKSHEFPDLSKNDDDESEDEEVEPKSPDKSTTSFALDGYNEGQTVLRVVNDDGDNESVIYKKRFIEKSSHYLVKSKAQLADEEERQRQRYARYGQPFKTVLLH